MTFAEYYEAVCWAIVLLAIIAHVLVLFAD